MCHKIYVLELFCDKTLVPFWALMRNNGKCFLSVNYFILTSLALVLKNKEEFSCDEKLSFQVKLFPSSVKQKMLICNEQSLGFPLWCLYEIVKHSWSEPCQNLLNWIVAFTVVSVQYQSVSFCTVPMCYVSSVHMRLRVLLLLRSGTDHTRRKGGRCVLGDARRSSDPYKKTEATLMCL